MAADRVEVLSRLVDQHEEGVLEAEELGAGIQRFPDQAVDVVDLGQAPRENIQLVEGRLLARGCGAVPIAAYLLHTYDTTHVDGSKLENAAHVRVRSNRVQRSLHALEQRSFRL